jgi:hypothetical protein
VWVYLQLHNDNIQDAATGVRNEYNRAQTRHEEQALRAQPQQPTRFCPSTGATPFLDAFLSSESMPTPTVDLATERFRATGGIGERMVQTEEDVAAVRDFIFGSQLTSTDGASAYLPSEQPIPWHQHRPTIPNCKRWSSQSPRTSQSRQPSLAARPLTAMQRVR